MKQVVYTNQPAKDYTEWYVRDAGGNTMATYRETYNPQGTNALAHTRQREVYLYGSDRLGVYTPEAVELSWAFDPLPTTGSLHPGHKAYELKDHLGNVRATVRDQGNPMSSTDYYPFGMAMATGSQGNGRYRYGFNGKEKDDELKGAGNSLDFGARIYDVRIGRWLSTDPLERKYPGITTYNFALNSPILFVDPEGEAARISVTKTSTTKVVTIESTVWLVGKDAKAASEQIKFTNKVVKVKDLEGNIWNVQVKITYKYDENVNKAIGEKGMSSSNDATKVVSQDIAKELSGTSVRSGDNIMQVDNSMFQTNQGHQGFTAMGASIGVSTIGALTHETGHQLGLDERYGEEGNHKSFGNDYMSGALLIGGGIISRKQTQ